MRADRRLHGRHGPRLRRSPVCKRDFNALRRHYRAKHRQALAKWRSSFTPQLASWYGPGFYGNTTACGQTYTATIIGVAHKSLLCGTKIWFRFNGRLALAPVIDRGPYVGGRTWDLSGALKTRLGCSGVCTVWTTTKPKP